MTDQPTTTLRLTHAELETLYMATIGRSIQLREKIEAAKDQGKDYMVSALTEKREAVQQQTGEIYAAQQKIWNRSARHAAECAIESARIDPGSPVQYEHDDYYFDAETMGLLNIVHVRFCGTEIATEYDQDETKAAKRAAKAARKHMEDLIDSARPKD